MNFAFSLVDPKQKQLDKVLSAWTAWRHVGEIANASAVRVASVDAALDVMLKALGKGDTLGTVWLYSDGDAQGRVVGALAGKGGVASLEPSAVSAFAQKSDKTKKLAAFASDATEVRVLGALARATENFGAWREALGGGKGSVVVADGYWQLALHHPSLPVTIPATSKDCKPVSRSMAPTSRHEFDAELSTLDAAVDTQVGKGCLAADRAEAVKKELRSSAKGYFERLLRQWCGLLDPGGEVPPALRSKATSSQIIDVMWDLWDAAGGIVYPFIGTKRVPLERTEKLQDVDALSKDKDIAAVTPRDATWPKRFVRKPTRVADAAAGKPDAALAAEQSKAEKLADGFRDTFKSAFRFANNKSFAGMGHPVGVRVLAKAEMAKEFDEFAAYLRDEDIKSYLKFNPQYIQDKLVKYYGHGMPNRLLDIDEHTQLTHEEVIITLGTTRPMRILPGGFYSAAKGTLFILQGAVEPGIIAHELCHAYASQRWNDFILFMTVRNLQVQMTVLDEAVTSELADVAIYAQPSESSSPSTSRPSGYVGYGADVQRQGSQFLAQVEGGSTAQATTMEAYFGGLVDVDEDAKKKPVDWTIVLGSKKVKKALSSLLIK